MPKIAYIERRFGAEQTEIVELANAIIEEYAAQGFILTLRQLYYQFVSRNAIANTEREYKRLGSIVNDGRLAGLIDWDAIEDRGRHVIKNVHDTDPKDTVEWAAKLYQLDRWVGQRERVELWVEKEALVGVFEDVCRTADVPLFACKGYVSQSEMWRASVRFIQNTNEHKQRNVILHFGDHDPSGLDMTRDIEARLGQFMAEVTVKRIALNIDQVHDNNLPPNPAKVTDSRFDNYVKKFGTESWELDALDPAYLVKLAEASIGQWVDIRAWKKVARAEARDKRKMVKMTKGL